MARIRLRMAERCDMNPIWNMKHFAVQDGHPSRPARFVSIMFADWVEVLAAMFVA